MEEDTEVRNVSIMIDLETLSLQPNALIAQVGACAFRSDLLDPAVREVFFRRVRWQDRRSLRGEYDVDPATVAWWMRQDDEARKSLCGDADDEAELWKCLVDLSSWMLEVASANNTSTDDLLVWANSPSFDLVILKNAYDWELSADPPWKFWRERDLRTYTQLYLDVTGEERPPSVAVNEALVKHRAVDDAIMQAGRVALMQRALRAYRTVRREAADG
jgi:hypothetical protein